MAVQLQFIASKEHVCLSSGTKKLYSLTLKCLVGFYDLSWRQRLAGFIHHGFCRGFCSPDSINIDNLVSDMDDKLLYSILKNKHHVLYQLLPPECSDCSYTLRPRRRELSPTKKSRLDEQNFIYRLIYKGTYWTDCNFYCSFTFVILLICDVLKLCLDSF